MTVSDRRWEIVPYQEDESQRRAREAEEEERRFEAEFDRDATRLERMQRAYEFHLAGMGTREIATHFDVSHVTIWKDIRDYKMFCARQILNPAEHLGAQLAECQTMRTAIWRDIRLRAVSAVDAARPLLAIQESERKLLDLVAFAARVDEFELMPDEELDG